VWYWGILLTVTPRRGFNFRECVNQCIGNGIVTQGHIRRCEQKCDKKAREYEAAEKAKEKEKKKKFKLF
jgi:hypothetical protein